MTDIDYPPSREWTLEAALADAEGADAPPGSAEANQREALAWAVDQFGGDATVTLQAFTTGMRSRTLDIADQTTMGELGHNQVQDWLTAAGVVDAPWLDGDEDLEARHELLVALPPALTDWLNAKLTGLNDLSEGN
jgi:hypothetical protein